MSCLFVDAGYWVALRDPTDAHHRRAFDVSKRVMQNRWRMVTTPFVFAEVYAIFSRSRQIRQQVVRDVWENPIVQVEQATFQDQQAALELVKQHPDKTYSFCDAVSFVMMMRLEIFRAVSFDGHFRQFGRFEIIDSL